MRTGREKWEEAGKQASIPPPGSHCRNTADNLLALDEVPPFPTQVESNSSTTSGKGSSFLPRVCTVLEAIRETQKSSLTKVLLLSEPREIGNVRY